MQFLSDRKIARDEETAEHAATVKLRGQAYAALRNYKADGTPSKEGEEAYEAQARNIGYQRVVARHKNNMNMGMGQLEAVKNSADAAQRARLEALDAQTVKEADASFGESVRGERIEYGNAKGRYERMKAALDAHADDENGYKIDSATGEKVRRSDYKHHFDDENALNAARDRYNSMREIMEGDVVSTQYVLSSAAHGYNTQRKVIETKKQAQYELAPPTQDDIYQLSELTTRRDAYKIIDDIIPGLRVLNQRGDTDLVRKQVVNILKSADGIELGTHASQALASFTMFDVGDADPWLKRFGKFINLETARVYNNNDRKNLRVTYDEYIKGYHTEPDGSIMYSKRGMEELMEGTSLDKIERTALANFDESLMEAYTTVDANGNKHLDMAEYLRKREKVQTSIGPQFISASLKYLSGSEQLKSAVRFLTGYEYKQKKNSNGTIATGENGEPLYEWKAIWEKGGDLASDPEKAQSYFERKTLQYIGDQTPTQILGLRSDYRDPLMDHLAKAYEDETEMKGWTDEEREEHREIMSEWSELQTKYGDMDTEEAREKYTAEANKLKKRMAGAQFRQLLNSKGKLNQIYRTRRSGAANNAKDWVREWLDLDNEVAITVKLEDDKRKLKEAYEEAKKAKKANKPEEPLNNGQSSDSPVDEGVGRIYNETDRAMFISEIEDMWQDLRDDDDDAFFDDSLEYINKTLGSDSFIAEQYKQFRKDDPYADSHALKEYLTDLLGDPDNY